MEALGVIIGIVGGMFSIVQGWYAIQDHAANARRDRAMQAAPILSVPAGVASASSLPFSPMRQSTPITSTSSQPAPGHVEVPAKRQRSLGSHPWIAAGAGLYLALYGLVLASSSDNQGLDVVFFLATLVFLVCWVAAIVQVIRMKRWGWLASLIFFGAVSTFIYGLFGPVHPVNSKVSHSLVTAYSSTPLGAQPPTVVEHGSLSLYPMGVAVPSSAAGNLLSPVQMQQPTAPNPVPTAMATLAAPGGAPMPPVSPSVRYCANGHTVHDFDAKFCPRCGVAL